jgi:enamine deaminase RidA (YjgF/YER057c/UK114 family)
MPAAVGYAHAVEAGPGRRVFLAGQVDMAPDGSIAHPGDLLAQVRGALAAIVRVLTAVGGRPEHVVRMRIYTTHVDAYKSLSRDIGRVYREHFGRWYPAMTLVGVARLYDTGALVEIETDAVIPGGEASPAERGAQEEPRPPT